MSVAGRRRGFGCEGVMNFGREEMERNEVRGVRLERAREEEEELVLGVEEGGVRAGFGSCR